MNIPISTLLSKSSGDLCPVLNVMVSHSGSSVIRVLASLVCSVIKVLAWHVCAQLLKYSHDVCAQLLRSSHDVCAQLLKSSHDLCAQLLRSSHDVCAQLLKSSHDVCAQLLRSSQDVCAQLLKSSHDVCAQLLKSSHDLYLLSVRPMTLCMSRFAFIEARMRDRLRVQGVFSLRSWQEVNKTGSLPIMSFVLSAKMENYNIWAKMSVEGQEININIYTKINNYQSNKRLMTFRLSLSWRSLHDWFFSELLIKTFIFIIIFTAWQIILCNVY